MTPPSRDAAARAFPWLLTAGIMLVALNLRAPIVALAPVLERIEADLGLTPATAGLLTTLAVLCFALATPVAALVIRLSGAERAVLIALLGVLAGTVLRSAGGVPAAFAGMLVIGVSITIGNVVIPVVIRRDVPPERAALVTGVYTAMLNVGTMITSLATAPLADLVGWRIATAAWGVFVLAALVVWGAYLRRRRRVGAAAADSDPSLTTTELLTGGIAVIDDRGGPGSGPGASVSAWRNPLTWVLTAAFAAQAWGYYGVTSWLPTMLADLRGIGEIAAGAASSIFQVAAIIGALGVPLLGARAPQWVPAAVVGSLWVSLPVGLLLAPEAYLVWEFLGGIAQGGGFVVIFTLIVRHARTDREAGGMSAIVQGGGYLIAALSPPVLGALHEATSGWTLPIAVLVGSTTTFLVLAVTATRVAERRR
ncbi:MFS transporter [Agromyces mangrovi Wang et al. 2018]|uniref:MFS transporter n=1 Tax=Agromyces mangrovi TaxID=1858653 RepID=UPI0025746141|nr:MFS transporter [Agromyces mangrovi]BDZ64872.1 MFS transporter [Agromyces mangrovi]